MDIDTAKAEVLDIEHRLQNIAKDIRALVDAEIMGDRYDEELREAEATIGALALDIGGMSPDDQD